MKKFTRIWLTAWVVAAIPAAAAPSATVTEAVNQVTHGSSQNVVSHPATVGTVLGDGEYLKTGADSRAEMELSNQTVTRLGANTLFNYNADSNAIDLQAGTVLFSKPKDGRQLDIKTQAVTAAIVGTTGFFRVSGHGSHTSYSFGLIEGTAHLTIDGTPYTIRAGDLLQFTPGQPPVIVSFNVPLMLKTSGLITKFHHALPNEKYIEREVALYDDLVARGFIQPAGNLYLRFNHNLELPNFPTVAWDSPANHLNQISAPPPPPSMSSGPPPFMGSGPIY